MAKSQLPFEIGDFVYVLADPEQERRQVIAYTVFYGGSVYFRLSPTFDEEAEFAEFQLSEKKNILGDVV